MKKDYTDECMNILWCYEVGKSCKTAIQIDSVIRMMDNYYGQLPKKAEVLHLYSDVYIAVIKMKVKLQST